MHAVRNSVLVIALVLCSAAYAQSQVVVGVHAQKRPFAVTGFTGDPTVAGQLTEVLKNDVWLSGCLALAQSSEAEFVQQGNVRSDTGGLTINVPSPRRRQRRRSCRDHIRAARRICGVSST